MVRYRSFPLSSLSPSSSEGGEGGDASFVGILCLADVRGLRRGEEGVCRFWRSLPLFPLSKRGKNSRLSMRIPAILAFSWRISMTVVMMQCVLQSIE